MFKALLTTSYIAVVVLSTRRADFYERDIYRGDLYTGDIYRGDNYGGDIYRGDIYGGDIYRGDAYQEELNLNTYRPAGVFSLLFGAAGSLLRRSGVYRDDIYGGDMYGSDLNRGDI